jgi:hypothetical protein
MSLLNGTMEQAIEALALRAADLRIRPPTYQEKQAEGMGDFLTGLGQQAQANPGIAGALLGGGLGAGLGGLSTAVSNSGKEPRDRRSMLSSLLGGGAAGAALGGGLGLAHQGIQGIRGPQGLSTGDALTPGQFRDASGQLQQVDPQAVRSNPQLAERLRQLQAPIPLHEKIPIEAAKGLKYLFQNMATPWIWGGMGAADAAFNAPGLNLGDRFGIGRVTPEHSINPEHLSAGLAALPEGAPPARVRTDLLNDKGTLRALARRSFFGTDPNANVFSREYANTEPIKIHETPSGGASGSSVTREGHQLTGTSTPEHITGGHIRAARETGARALNNGELPSLRRIGGRQWTPNRALQIGGRVGAYGIVPFAELAISGLARESANAEELRRLVAAHARPIAGR